MNKFKVGSNFDDILLELLIDCNSVDSDSKITELYGSIRDHADLAARPDFRLPMVSNEKFEAYVRHAADHGIDFNYTLNSIFPYGNKRDLYEHRFQIANLVRWLEDCGVKRITIATPIMAYIIRDVAKSNIALEVSTIAHVETVTQIKYWKENFGIDKVCNNLLLNRNFIFLKRAAKYCNDHGIMLELMVNEFCGVGGKDYATNCIYRDSCYICHSQNKSPDDAMLFNNYPMDLCTMSRYMNPSNWLKLRFIRPEDLKAYNDIGITNFKITGRTGSTDYIMKVVNAYMSGKFNGNLLELWKPLESIYDPRVEGIAKQYIDNSKLSNHDFISKWSKEYMDCENHECGVDCRYCEEIYKKVVE